MVSKTFNPVSKNQTEEDVLKRMALTFLYPNHKNAFINSCHSSVARAIGKLDQEEKAVAKILLFGQNNRVYHSILVVKEDTAVDFWHDRDGYRYDPDKKEYAVEKAGVLSQLTEISLSDFFEKYVANAIIFKSIRAKPLDL